jgi:hypothetical protein
MMETILKDLRYGAKMLWKSKGVTIVAVVSLAVGIGANSAIFSLVNSILLRPRAVAQPKQVVELFVGDAGHPYETASYPMQAEPPAAQAVPRAVGAVLLGGVPVTGNTALEAALAGDLGRVCPKCWHHKGYPVDKS